MNEKRGGAVLNPQGLLDPEADEAIRRMRYDMKELDDGSVETKIFLWGDDTSDDGVWDTVCTKTTESWAEAIDMVCGMLAWVKEEVAK